MAHLANYCNTLRKGMRHLRKGMLDATTNHEYMPPLGTSLDLAKLWEQVCEIRWTSKERHYTTQRLWQRTTSNTQSLESRKLNYPIVWVDICAVLYVTTGGMGRLRFRNSTTPNGKHVACGTICNAQCATHQLGKKGNNHCEPQQTTLLILCCFCL